MDTRGIIGLIANIRHKANSFITNRLKELGVQNIVPQHGSVLVQLFKQDVPVQLKEIVEKSGKAKSTITSIIQTLEKHGYVSRMNCDTDRRAFLIKLTQKGKDLKSEFDQVSSELSDYAYGDIPVAERESVITILKKIETNMK